MKNQRNGLVFTIVGLAAMLLASCSDEVVLASYNIRNGRGLDEQRDIARTAAVLKALDADIIAVQEVDSMTHRSGETDVLRLLAEATGMHAVYAPAIDYDGGRYGVGILSREKPLSVSRYPLPGREERRVLLAVEFKHCVFACTHLSLTEEDRLLSLPMLTALAETSPKSIPLFVAGDFNATPDEPFIELLTEHFELLTDIRLPTSPADNPKATIDYIVCRRDRHMPTVLSASVVPEPVASDHRPIVCRLRW
jgi:endonuclease/exonuclease/phosphatase family metal-dependent hydrolase